MNVQFQCPTYSGQPMAGVLAVHVNDGGGDPACHQHCGPWTDPSGVKHPSVPTLVNLPATCLRKGCLG